MSDVATTARLLLDDLQDHSMSDAKPILPDAEAVERALRALAELVPEDEEDVRAMHETGEGLVMLQSLVEMSS